MNFWWPLMVLRKKTPGCQCSDLGLVLQHLYCSLAPHLVGLFPIPRPRQLCSSCSFSSFCPDPVPLDFCMIGSLFDSQLKCQFLRKNFCNHFLLSHSLACHFIWFAPCFCSVAESCPILCDPMDCSMPGFSVLHYLLEFPQTHVHWVGDATQPSHPLLPLLLLPLIFPSIKAFSNESGLCIS